MARSFIGAHRAGKLRPLPARVVALPRIGTLDSAWTSIVMESLLERIVSTGSEIAIIDITGVSTVDTLVGQHLLKTVAAARRCSANTSPSRSTLGRSYKPSPASQPIRGCSNASCFDCIKKTASDRLKRQSKSLAASG
jgi:hypothetical protein